MNKHYQKFIRDNLPDSLKLILAPFFRNKLIKNKLFGDLYEILENRSKLDNKQIEEFQFSNLKNILIHSFQNVPYYNELFNKVGFNPYRFSAFQEMEKIPVLTREIINQNFDKLISRKKIKNGYYIGSTGGSSGVPLRFLLDYDSIYKENAFIYHFRKQLGYDFKDRCATFRQTDYRNLLWHLNPMHNELILSPFRLSALTIKNYVHRINKFNPQYLNGYLSAIWFFAKLMEENNLTLNCELKGIFLISENNISHQRSFVEKFFKVKSVSFYGHSERCVFAVEQAPGKYCFDPYYGYTEFMPYKNEWKLIVGTGFLNYTMPLIRYQTDDSCYKERDHFSIEGKRASNKGLVGINGEFLSSSTFDLENPVFNHVLNYQFIQKEKGKAVLNIVVSKSFKESELEIYKKEIDKHSKGVIDITINIVDNLILSPRGKYQMYISYLQGNGVSEDK